MKRVIDLLFVLVLLTFAFPALAQDEGSLSEIASKKTHRDNWYISVGPSANVIFGEQDQLVSPLKRLKLGGELSIGKWFNPNTGLSLNIIGGGLRGFNLTGAPFETGYYTDNGVHLYSPAFGGPGHPRGGPFYNSNGSWNTKYTRAESKDGAEGFWQDFNYATTTVDIMGNITNLFRGYAVDNAWFELIGFAGVGANFAYGNGYSTSNFWWLTGRVGVRGNFNITKNFAIYLEPSAYPTDPEFDGYKGTSVGDLYASLSLGIQYTFNKKVSSFEKVTIDELDRLNRRVNENRDLINNHQDILERQQRLLDKLGNNLSSKDNDRPIPIIRQETSKALPEYVRFALDSYRIERSEYSKIQNVVDFMKQNPGAKILLVGYADRKTGNATYNYGLSKKRVDAVLGELNRFGIDESRLFVEWKGDKEQPFAANDWNRVVIMVERK
ncbi:porin [Bacteroidia bacterium]|nr:porin [Bacteroidia bacterium]GHT61936.1 porin [Bacteroidia bacterium]